MALIQELPPGKAAARYEFKPGRYSSHMLVLGAFPEDGHERTILDLGCSGGELSRRLLERGFAVTCVDKPGDAPSALPAAVRFVAADLDEGIPASLASRFDYVICADVLEHLKEPDRLLAALRGVMAEQGRLIASLPNSGNLYFRFNVLMGRFLTRDRGLFDRTHLHFYTWRGWVELFEHAGFRIETVRPTTIPFSLVFPRLARTAIVGAMESLYYLAARTWKEMFAYQFVVVARQSILWTKNLAELG
jgi:SAM-dependent methyltransferase